MLELVPLDFEALEACYSTTRTESGVVVRLPFRADCQSVMQDRLVIPPPALTFVCSLQLTTRGEPGAKIVLSQCALVP